MEYTLLDAKAHKGIVKEPEALPFSSSQKRNLELRSEFDESKKCKKALYILLSVHVLQFCLFCVRVCVAALFREVLKLPEDGCDICNVSTPPPDELLPWSSVSSVTWKKTLRKWIDRHSSAERGVVRYLRLRRGTCLHWDLVGVALFTFYLWKKRSADPNTSGMWTVNIMLPAAFLLMSHPLLKSHEGLQCAATLPDIPFTARPWFRPSIINTDVVSDCGCVSEMKSERFASYVSSMLSFDWKEDLVADFISMSKTLITPERKSYSDYVLARCQTLRKGLRVVALQNTFLLCQLVVSAMVRIKYES